MKVGDLDTTSVLAVGPRESLRASAKVMTKGRAGSPGWRRR